MSGRRILVVDDDPDVRSLVRELLTRAGYELDEAPDGRTALRQLYAQPPELVLLDITMPEMDGWQTLERIRDLSDVPVLMLTARGDELERVRGLKAGADDYVTKPFGRQELLARVEAVLRRSAGARATARETYADDLIAIDYNAREVTVAGEPVALTPLELRLLTAFVDHPNQVLSRGQLLELAWRSDRDVLTDQVKLYVGYLRKKLGEGAERIETVRGFGYRYRPAGVADARTPPN
jgi:DNA-binding response OmpR family regulator